VERILVVDDEYQIRELYRQVLERYGYHCRVASSAAEALQVHEEWQPQLIVTDLAMPLMDGMKLVKSIRAENESVKILVVSGNIGLRYSLQQLKEAGVTEVAHKPLGPRDFLTLVRALD
jgi:DNA-binding response OmpR family regulator